MNLLGDIFRVNCPGCVTLGEAQKYLTFLNFIGEEFVKSDAIREQLEEQKIFVERIEQNPNYKR